MSHKLTITLEDAGGVFSASVHRVWYDGKPLAKLSNLPSDMPSALEHLLNVAHDLGAGELEVSYD